METVGALKRENKKLGDELKSAEGSTGFNSKFQGDLQTREESYEMVQRKTDIEFRKQREYANKIAEYQGMLTDKRRVRADTMGGVNATQENHQVVDKQIKVLENRLDQALVKFNEALSFNKVLREQIDNLRRERVCNVRKGVNMLPSSTSKGHTIRCDGNSHWSPKVHCSREGLYLGSEGAFDNYSFKSNLVSLYYPHPFLSPLLLRSSSTASTRSSKRSCTRRRSRWRRSLRSPICTTRTVTRQASS